MNSRDADTLIEDLLTALDPHAIHVAVIARIEVAFASFLFPSEQCNSNQALIRSVSRFVAHLYAHGLVPAKAMNEMQARQEAVYLMEQTYTNGISSGYEAALLDALDRPEESMPLIFQRIAAAIAARERANHMAFVMAKIVDPADWITKVAMTRKLLDRSVLEKAIKVYGAGTVFELAHHLEDLVICEYQTEAQVLRVLQGRRALISADEHSAIL